MYFDILTNEQNNIIIIYVNYEREVRIIDIQELKNYIIANDKIEKILGSLSCHSIKDKGGYYTCGHPLGDNPSSIVIYKDQLTVTQYTREKTQGDLIALVMNIKHIDFISALKFIHKELNLPWKNKKPKPKTEPQSDPLSVFTSKLKSKHKHDVGDIDIYDEGILMDFGDCIHKDYCDGRITEQVRKEFGLCYDFQRKRTVIPWRNYKGVVGLSGRTSVPLYKELGINKFWAYNGGFKKSKCLYGYCENYAHIQKAGYVVVFEAEKSVLIRASLGDRTCVAIGGSNISDEQIGMILGLNVDIIVALDNDQPKENIKEICKKFSKYRNTYFIWDKWGLLGDKDSPADANNKTYNFLMKYKVKYTNGKG